MMHKMYAVLFLLVVIALNSSASETLVGTASRDMTPPLPLALGGQMHLRIADEVQSPLTASILAVEKRENATTVDVAIFVTLELVVIPDVLRDEVRQKVQNLLPDIEVNKIIISASHTHTAPEIRAGRFLLPDGVTTVKQVVAFISDQVAEGVREAWNTRTRGSMTWGLGHAKVGLNRRAVYYDGSAKMYGRTDLPEFRGIEGYEDHDVDVLFIWDEQGKLIGTCINLACPAQEVEGRNSVNADFWHPVREQLRDIYGAELMVMSWIGASGDQSPHLMYNRDAEDRMQKLRNLTRLEEIARRIVNAVTDVYEVVKEDRYQDVDLKHEVKELELPRRLVTVDAVREAQNAIHEIESMEEEEMVKNYRRIKWHQSLVDRYENQKENPDQPYNTEVHLIRLGDVAICTNQFELFTEYGIRMKARSKALQTFVVQLSGPGTYLPTMEALKGGHYSAIIQSNEVGPEAGDLLVEETVRGINRFWNEE
ncbi:hypothetical protein KUV50_16015 [Membranicola marinus]|uniref:Neutral/alkaline non-lysosomal ceramidase, N-terminal n=1 Tax=Membranihabitans marinus TaxID=1227546 RepID=A0A953HW99_9BACT|nr:hypothetical protein [Membranihabitans marinus]MBY5959660.1 hypothetical protein [Membranihabitans marinus]